MNSYSKQSITKEDIDAVLNALQSPILTGGKSVEEFEENIAQYVGVKYAVSFSSGTAALHGAYSVAGLEKNDEFITTPLTFVATANAGVYLGATPKLTDIKYNGQIDEEKLTNSISKKTKLIAPVDYAGNPCAIEEINRVAKENGLIVVEDASHALGSSIDNKKIGFFADMTIFSFHPVKPITTFEGGMVVTDSEEFYNQLKLFRSHGIVKKSLWNQDMVSLGYNYRLSDVASALGISQLKRLDEFIAIRNEIADYYDQELTSIEEISTIKLPANHKSSRHLYPILLDRSLFCSKEDVFRGLQEAGIGVQVHYKPVNKHSFYKNSFNEEYPVAEEFYKAELTIPCHQSMTVADGKKVVNAIKDVLNRTKGCNY